MTIHFSLSLSEVSYKFPHLSYVKSFLIDTFQHWLLYDKLSSNNNIDNYHHVNVVQICVSELTTCKAFVLYNAYITVLTCVNTDVNSVLEVNQQQLALYAHSSQTMVILTLFNDNILFVQNCITLNQMRTHQSLYINTILIQSQSMLISISCTYCQKCSMTLFLKCCCTSEHFSECCSNCKWCDYAAHCSVCNNDVLIVILNNENNNNTDENECIVKLRQIASALLSQVCNETDAQLIISKYKKNTMKREKRASYRSEKIMCFSLRVLVSN